MRCFYIFLAGPKQSSARSNILIFSSTQEFFRRSFEFISTYEDNSFLFLSITL